MIKEIILKFGHSRGRDESQAVPSSPPLFHYPQFQPYQSSCSILRRHSFHVWRSCRLDSRSPTDKSLCCSRCQSASARAPKQALSSAWCTSGPKLTSYACRHMLWEHA